MRLYLIFLLLLPTASFTDVVSTKGQIKFDIQLDGQAEMTLNSIGLGIGISPSANLHINGNAMVSEKIFIGNTAGSSNLNVNGTLGYSTQTVSSNTILGDASFLLVNSSGDNIKLDLPYAGNVINRQYQIKKISTSNSVWISGGGNLIDEKSLIELTSGNLGHVKLISNGEKWLILDLNGSEGEMLYHNLEVWLKLDENFSETIDSSKNSLSITTIGQNSGNFMLDGPVQNSVYFDGIDDYLGISGSYNKPTTEFTVSFWLNQPTLTNQSELFGDFNYNGGAYYGYLVRVSNQSISVWAGDGSPGENIALSDDFLVSNQWMHIVIRWKNGTTEIFYNGNPVSMSDTTTIGSISYTGTGMSLGATSAGTNWFIDGSLDDVRLYSKYLTEDEIHTLYSLGNP